MDVNFAEIEKKWQKRWADAKIFEAKEGNKKKKYYVLEMFPYPSGSGLHMGHAWNYSIGDILARFKIMNGFNVLHPMGYDALGLPAENAAIKEGTHPEDYTKKSTANFIKQQKMLGLSYDWSRMVNTSDPEYYKWDQWIFLKMFEKGLAFQKEANVNWCPGCKTVLANEQAQTGNCERCGSKVDIKNLKQWFLKITDYADELYEGIEDLKDWPARTKAMQKNWIGKSHGTEIDFEVNGEKWPIFTTRCDTIFGVTFVVVSAQHKKLGDLVTEEQKPEVEKFLKKLKSVSEKDLADLEKEGVFTGSYAINPSTDEKIPIWIANFVIADYGSGMVMADAHDQRDLEFAHKYKINLIETIVPENEKSTDPNKSKRAFTEHGILVNSGKFNGLKTKEAIEKITEWLAEKGKARKVVNFKLRDWGISRQRYWGTPIPIVHCEKCGAVPVAEKDLPVKLPKNVEFGEGNPLETNEKWIKTKCPKCGGDARRETDTMDTFVNSSWYFLRYCDPKNDKKIFEKAKAEYWCPIDSYIGGAEHACMHLIYSRFYTKFLADLGLIDFREPAKSLFHQGMLRAEGGSKMSKSKGNVVLPEIVSDEYGIDTARFFLSSLASPDKDIDWSEKGIVGSLKFINKIFDYFENLKFVEDSDKVKKKLNMSVKRITEFYNGFAYRKATIELRELFEIIASEKCSKETLESFLKLLSPICPHITEELWGRLGNKEFISIASWPVAGKVISSSKKDSSKLLDNLKKEVERIKKSVGKDKVYVYVLPSEIDLYKDFEGATVYSVADKEKYDPANKSKRVKPGNPAIYVE